MNSNRAGDGLLELKSHSGSSFGHKGAKDAYFEAICDSCYALWSCKARSEALHFLLEGDVLGRGWVAETTLASSFSAASSASAILTDSSASRGDSSGPPGSSCSLSRTYLFSQLISLQRQAHKQPLQPKELAYIHAHYIGDSKHIIHYISNSHVPLFL